MVTWTALLAIMIALTVSPRVHCLQSSMLTTLSLKRLLLRASRSPAPSLQHAPTSRCFLSSSVASCELNLLSKDSISYLMFRSIVCGPLFFSYQVECLSYSVRAKGESQIRFPSAPRAFGC